MLLGALMETRLQRAGGRRKALICVVVSLVAAAAGVCGCEAILGMDGDDAHLAASGSSTDAETREEAAVSASPCVFSSTGDATLRVGNLVPSTTRVDVCLHRSGAASPIDGKPIVASARGSCPAGLGYKDVTIPFELPSGTYRVSFVPFGSSCNAAPLGTSQITTATTSGAGAYLLGGGPTAPTTGLGLGLGEETPPVQESMLRFVNAIPGGGPLDFDLALGPTLPTTAKAVISSGVTFGSFGASTNAEFPTDSDGYTQISLLGGALPVGAAPAGSSTIALVADPALAGGDSYTAFAIGLPSNPSYPEELYVCDEMKADGILTQCAGGSVDVTVDVFDPYLWGPFAPLEPLREQAVVSAIATLPSDVVCIPDAFPDALDQEIIAQAKTNFPYAVHFADTLATPVDDPTLEDGGVPAAPTIPPCGGGLDGQLEPFLACVSAYCTSPLDADDASVFQEPAACLSNNCASEAEALLLSSDPQDLKCWTCALYNLQGAATIAQTRSACTTDVNAGYAFSGQSGVLLLSRYPIGGAEQWVLPSTDWRTSIVRAPLTIGAQRLDAYCMILSDPVSSITVPYTGSYGNGGTGVAGWDAELALQVQKVVAYVQAKSSGTPAVISGELYTGPAAADGTPSFNPAMYQVLASAFALAATPSGPPGCTFCATNPIISPPGSTPAGENELTNYALLANVPVTDVLSTSIELQTPFLDAGPTDAGAWVVPLSTYYDYRATVRIRP
ncbi:MAG: hypothetical protein ACLQVI_03440 [Polyangiaceae bacterium]